MDPNQKIALRDLKEAEQAALDVFKTVHYNILHSSRLLELAKDHIKIAFSLGKEAIRNTEYK